MRIQMPKTVIFCRTLQNCATFFATIKRLLGKNITDPPGALYNGHLECRLVEVFTAVSTPKMREAVLKEFCKPDTKLRVLVATTAFGMGVDCPDIDIIINWGCPNTLEELVQETGRGGRDGRSVKATLYPTRSGKKITQAMKKYRGNTKTCRRRQLFKNFLFYEKVQLIKACQCCDLCVFCM